MLAIATAVQQSIVNRIHAGIDVNDQPAPALKSGYARQKARKSPPAIRNWWYTGFTLRCLKVLEYSARRAVIGFLNATRPGQRNPRSAAEVAHFLNLGHRQFGMSPKDRDVLIISVRAESGDHRGTS